MTMDPMKITEFARLLKDNGDKVLNSNYKLTLSGSLLRSLNDSFPLVVDEKEFCPPKNFQVAKSNNSKSDAIRDLLFIHDFIQKTSILCLTNFDFDDKFTGIADITKFRNLKKLEIQKLNVEQVCGIQPLRSQLREIVCVRKSIKSVKDIISFCGGDHSNGFVWNELIHADFSCNGLTTIDCSLEFAPWLQNLNLSHNHIISADALKWLKHLKYLDLSFNKLTHIPMLNIEACKGIQILILSNNFIEDLSVLTYYRFDSLYELDLSGNCLLDHTVLMPISTLASLKYLSLIENPISFDPKHREIVSKYLNKNISNEKFILNGEFLSKYEKMFIGKERINFVGYSSSFKMSNQREISHRRQGSTNSKTNSICSEISLNDTESFDMNSSSMTESSTTQKKIKIRKPVILDHGSENTEKKDIKPVKQGNTEHLETKKNMEELRQEYGDHWLESESANPYKRIGVNYVIPKKQNSSENMIKQYLINSNDNQNQNQNNTKEDENEIFFESSSGKTVIEKNILTSTPTEESVIKTINEVKQNITSTDTSLTEFYSAESSDDIYPSNTDDNISLTEENEYTYDVENEKTNEKFFLVVSDISIREKNVNTRKTKSRWLLKTVESCERSKSDVINIQFKTAKIDKKCRSYKIDPTMGKKLEQYLRDILSNRSLPAMNQRVYRCINCNVHFCREITLKKTSNDIRCPECRNIYVVEVKDCKDKSPGLSSSKSELEKSSTTPANGPTIPHSASQSSIGSVGSLNESSSCSKISNSESSFDSNQSVAGSSNYERDQDADVINFNKCGAESDIEILSNPSQSSIEVLDSIYANRKYSEERKIIHVPKLDTITDDNDNCNLNLNLSTTLTDQCTSTNDIDDNNDSEITKTSKQSIGCDTSNDKKSLLSGNVRLTESSSSGSVTDSICTAYEQSQVKSDNSLDNTNKSVQNTSSVNDVKNNESSVISSMLNNLLQSTNLLLSKSQRTNELDDSNQEIECFKFSYTNFTEVDHRIKLYFYQNLFEDENEHFKWLTKASIIDENTSNECENLFDGILILSTTKCYILKIINEPLDNDPQKWLKRYLSVTVDRLEYFKVLPWKIGMEIKIKGIGYLQILLLDILRTDSLLLHISSNLPDSCSIEYQVSDVLIKKLYTLTENNKIQMFGILKSCDIIAEDKKEYQLCTIIITETTFYLVKNFKWILNKFHFEIELNEKQDMTNLVEYKKLDELSYIFYFLDDSNDKCENWEVVFETEECAESTFNAISQSWEKLFDVPLTSN